jgi:hypothetical protein
MAALDNSHALVVGIANYQHINTLPPTILSDAQDIYNLLIDPQHCGYLPANVQLLVDGEATLAAIRQALAKLAQCSNPDATVFFYLSGHGGRLESGSYAGEYLLTVDTFYTSDQSLAETAISGAEFTTALRAIPARKVVVVFDCCHASGIGQPKEVTAPKLKPLPESYYEALTSGRGRVILASSRSTEFSYVLPDAANSLFTQHLLAGLRGGTPGPGGVIRIFDLFHYLQPRVTSDQPNQHPIFKAELEENFPIALFLGGKAPAPMPSAPRSDHFAYDVFISYRRQEPDRSWVRRTLQPQIEAQGLRACIDHRDFRLGAPGAGAGVPDQQLHRTRERPGRTSGARDESAPVAGRSTRALHPAPGDASPTVARYDRGRGDRAQHRALGLRAAPAAGHVRTSRSEYDGGSS